MLLKSTLKEQIVIWKFRGAKAYNFWNFSSFDVKHPIILGNCNGLFRGYYAAFFL